MMYSDDHLRTIIRSARDQLKTSKNSFYHIQTIVNEGDIMRLNMKRESISLKSRQMNLLIIQIHIYDSYI